VLSDARSVERSSAVTLCTPETDAVDLAARFGDHSCPEPEPSQIESSKTILRLRFGLFTGLHVRSLYRSRRPESWRPVWVRLPPSGEELAIPIDTLRAYVGVDESVADADRLSVRKDLAGTPAWSTRMTPPSSSVARQARPKIVKKHKTPTRAGGVPGGGVGLATGLIVALFRSRPSVATAARTTAGGTILGAVARHAAAGMSRHDLRELASSEAAAKAEPNLTGRPRTSDHD
jgi:hypothetical protein